jgi:hypothetical protein
MSTALMTEFSARVGDPLSGLPTREALERRDLFLEWLAARWNDAVTGSDPQWLASLTTPPLQDVLDEYFKDGSLEPVVVADPSGFPFGTTASPEAAQALLDRQLAEIERVMTDEQLDANTWRRIGQAFGAITARQMALGGPAGRFGQVRSSIEELFVPWVLSEFSSLTSLPAIPSPVVVHRAIRAMQLTRSGGKAALIVMDGMSLAAWELIAPALSDVEARITQSVSFGYIPTLTTVSRQAIFAGTLPAHFEASVETTSKESEHWQTAWMREANLDPAEVAYDKFRLVESNDESALLERLRSAGIGRQILGLAIEDIDLLVHSEVFDELSLYQRLVNWSERKVFARLIQALLHEGYRVYVTSDHGFIAARSIGGSKAGATADSHGRFERYTDPAVADAAAAKHQEAWRRWDGYGLPPSWHIVFAPMFDMYFTDRHTRLTHGGPTMEEVLVPWVEISP